MLVSPLTQSDDVTLIKTIQVQQLIRDWQKSFQIDITDELQGYSNIYLYQCNQTHLKFFMPSDVAGSARLYEQLQKFDWFYMPQKWEHQIALKNLRRGDRVLEIGCAFGSFVEAGMKQGIHIQGIEFNEAAVKVAQSKNLPVSCMGLEELANSSPLSLDAVCSFQVLEHTANPKDFIRWSVQLLKPGGKLILCVPNSESFLQHQYNLLDMPPHHMLQWSRTSFKALEKMFPLMLEKVIREPLAEYHIEGYLAAYGQYFRERSPLNKLLFNRFTLQFYQQCLRLGWRRFLVGQSLYVQFHKTHEAA